jgi:hypothetical protein
MLAIARLLTGPSIMGARMEVILSVCDEVNEWSIGR